MEEDLRSRLGPEAVRWCRYDSINDVTTDDGLPRFAYTREGIKEIDVESGALPERLAMTRPDLVDEVLSVTDAPVQTYANAVCLHDAENRPHADMIDFFITAEERDALSEVLPEIQRDYCFEGILVTWHVREEDGSWTQCTFEHCDGVFMPFPPYEDDLLEEYYLFGYPEPVPFGTVEGPKFPIHTLPKWIRKFVVALSEAVQFPVTGVAAFLCGFLAACLQGRIVVQPKPDPTYIEPVNLYVLIAAPSSSGKSPTLSYLLAPLLAVQDNERELAAVRREVAAGELKKIEKEIESLKDKLGDGAVNSTKLVELVGKRRELEAMNRASGESILHDATPEVMVRRLDTEKAIILPIDELHLGTLFGYRWADQNLTLLLQGYTGSTYVFDRVTFGKIFLDHPLITIVCGVQPQVVGEYLATKEVIERGLGGRTFIVFAGDRFGGRVYETEEVPQKLALKYEQLVKSFYALPLLGKKAPRITLSDAAYRLQSAFYRENDRKMADGPDPQLVSFLGKITGGAARVAAILHAAKYFDQDAGVDFPVSAETMQSAIEIAEFFRAHSELAYGEIDNREDVQQRVWARIQRDNLREFSKNDLFRAMKGSKFVKRADDLDGPLAGLVDRGYLIPLDEEDRSGKPGRRPSPRFAVNPRVVGFDDDATDEDA